MILDLNALSVETFDLEADAVSAEADAISITLGATCPAAVCVVATMVSCD